MILLFARCLLGCPGTTRQHPASGGTETGQVAHSPVFTGTQSTDLIAEQRTLNRGFGVQVPDGAPVLTWGYASSGLPREGRFGAMFAPRLLVSPDLVVRVGQHAR
jgi:hypothetical protein